PPSFFQPHAPARDLPSFPTRRSSDLLDPDHQLLQGALVHVLALTDVVEELAEELDPLAGAERRELAFDLAHVAGERLVLAEAARSEEHTSELQSRENLVCRLLLEKKK